MGSFVCKGNDDEHLQQVSLVRNGGRNTSGQGRILHGESTSSVVDAATKTNRQDRWSDETGGNGDNAGTCIGASGGASIASLCDVEDQTPVIGNKTVSNTVHPGYKVGTK